MRDVNRLLWHRVWMTPIFSYVGLLSLIWIAFNPMLSHLPLFLVATFMLLMGVTVGMHRLFCHQAFQTSRFWQAVLALFGTLAFYGSTVQWAAMHVTHHKFADTPRDPHYTGWRYLFWKKNRPTEFNRRALARLYRDDMHRVLHNMYIAIPFTYSAILLLAGGIDALIYGYLAPLGWLHLVGSFHQVFAHGKNGARQLPLMEILMFTGGEWNHGHHHARPGDLKFGMLDAGYYFIRAIQKPLVMS